MSDMGAWVWYNADMAPCGGELLEPWVNGEHCCARLTVCSFVALYGHLGVMTLLPTQGTYDLFSQLADRLGQLGPYRILRVIPCAHVNIYARKESVGLFNMAASLFHRLEFYGLDFQLEEIVLPLPLFLNCRGPVRCPFLLDIIFSGLSVAVQVCHRPRVVDDGITSLRLQAAPESYGFHTMFKEAYSPTLTCGERLTRLDISLPSLPPDSHAGENNEWDTDVAELLSQLPVLQHFAARNTAAGVLLFFQP